MIARAIEVITCLEVLVVHTKGLCQILEAVDQISTNLGRTMSTLMAIAIAQLVLKHHQNKNLWHCVIVLVSSPLDDASLDVECALVHLAKKLKKDNVAPDMIAFSDSTEQAGVTGLSSQCTFQLLVLPFLGRQEFSLFINAVKEL